MLLFNQMIGSAFYARSLLLLTSCLSLCGCLTFFNPKGEENPSEWMREIVDWTPTWRLILDRTPDNNDWPLYLAFYNLKKHDTIALSYYGVGDWLVKTEFGVDVWRYDRQENGRNLLPENKYGILEKNHAESLFKNGSAFIYSTQYTVKFVAVNIDQVFKENPWCNMIWLDDGLKGMCYHRGEPYAGRIIAWDEHGNTKGYGPVTSLYRAGLESNDYKTFCEESSKYLMEHPKKLIFAPDGDAPRPDAIDYNEFRNPILPAAPVPTA